MSDLEENESRLTRNQTRRIALKRKSENSDKENIAPQQQDDKQSPTAKKHKLTDNQKVSLTQLVDNCTQTSITIEPNNHENLLLLNMNCQADPLYDDWINNQSSLLDETEIVKAAAPSIPISESSYELFTITTEARIEPCEVYHQHNETPNESEVESAEPEKVKNASGRKEETKETKKKEVKAPTLETLIRKVPDENPKAKEINFALNLIKKMFTVDEIKVGIFGNKNNKSSSKSQVPFDFDKTQEFKESIAKKFSYDEDKMNYVWSFLAPKLNKKLCDIRRQLKKFN